MKQLELIGKTIAAVEYNNQYDDGISLIFTDDTCLTVSERMLVIYEGEVITGDDE